MNNTCETTDRSINHLTNELLEDLQNPTLGSLELCQLHNLTLPELAAILDSESYQQAVECIARISTARDKLLEPESKSLAKARLTDLLKTYPETDTQRETQRKAATTLLSRSPATRPHRPSQSNQPSPHSSLAIQRDSVSVSPMNPTNRSIALLSLSTLTTLAAAGPNSATEDYTSGTGITSSYTAFAGTPAEALVTLPVQDVNANIWVGDVAGLVSELANPFYNDTINFPDGTPVLAFGPADLHSLLQFDFPVEVTSITFTIYDIETPDAVRVTGFDDNETETYNSGLLSATELNQTTFTNTFDPPIRMLQILANNSDGLMLSPITINYTPLNTCQADLNNDGVLDFFDISAFLSAFSTNNPIADLNNDSAFDFFDISAFLTAFSAGCP